MRAAARRTSAVLREPTAARHIPYSAHVNETVVRTFAGDYVQAFRLAGVSFESADDETLNNWHRPHEYRADSKRNGHHLDRVSQVRQQL